MEILFKHLQKKQLTKQSNSSKQILLYEQLAAQTHHIETLQKGLEKWTQWFQQQHPDTPVPVETISHEESKTEQPNTPQTQPFVLTSDTGQYMVLHRVNEVAPPECISWLKQNGPETFESILNSLPNTIEFEPAMEGIDTWNSVSPETSKRFVHNFFRDIH
jgi:hypothetical protein